MLAGTKCIKYPVEKLVWEKYYRHVRDQSSKLLLRGRYQVTCTSIKCQMPKGQNDLIARSTYDHGKHVKSEMGGRTRAPGFQACPDPCKEASTPLPPRNGQSTSGKHIWATIFFNTSIQNYMSIDVYSYRSDR